MTLEENWEPAKYYWKDLYLTFFDSLELEFCFTPDIHFNLNLIYVF